MIGDHHEPDAKRANVLVRTVDAILGTHKTNGTWGTAIGVPGSAALNKGGRAALDSLSCASAGHCGAGGTYTDASGARQAFVVTRS
jgi:hypothetical protein